MKKTERKLAWWAAIVLLIAIAAAMISFVIEAKKMTDEERENNVRSVAQLVDHAVTNSFVKPITVAKTMSEDTNLKEYLIEAAEDAEGAEAGISEYLTSLRDGLGYKMMFAVCDESGAYYTCDGIASYIDKNYEGNSEWYGNFINSERESELDVDIEESTGWALSVFANQLVKDDENNVIGVCGTAVEMTQLQSLVEEYERRFNVKIDVTDETGLIQIDTDVERIENDHITLPELSLVSDGEYYYEKLDSGDRVITYMEETGLYLIVTNIQNANYDLISYVRIPAIFLIVGIIAAVGLMIYAKYNNKHTVE